MFILYKGEVHFKNMICDMVYKIYEESFWLPNIQAHICVYILVVHITWKDKGWEILCRYLKTMVGCTEIDLVCLPHSERNSDKGRTAWMENRARCFTDYSVFHRSIFI